MSLLNLLRRRHEPQFLKLPVPTLCREPRFMQALGKELAKHPQIAPGQVQKARRD